MKRKPREIEVRHLRCFIITAEHGSFRKVALVVGIQQSTLSRCVHTLEDLLGASLFNRHQSGVTLTYAGEKFLPLARGLLRGLEESSQAVASLGRSENGRIRIGIYSSIASGFLAELLRAFGDQHNQVQIKLIDGSPEEHVAAIRGLKLDVAFLTGTRTWQDCDSALMWSEGVFVVLPENHELAARSAVRWMDLCGEVFIVSAAAPGQEIYNYLVKNLATLSWHPDIQVQSLSRDNLLSLVAIGQGLTLVNEAMTVTQFPGVMYRPILGERLPFSAVWSPQNDNPAFRRLLSLAQSMAARFPPSTLGNSDGPSQTHDPSP